MYLVVPKQGSPPANVEPDVIEQSVLPSQLKYKITIKVNSRHFLRLSVTCVYLIYVTEFLGNRTTSMPKSVHKYSLEKGQYFVTSTLVSKKKTSTS